MIMRASSMPRSDIIIQPDLVQRALDTERLRPALAEQLGYPVASLAIERVLFSKSRPVVIHYRASDEMAVRQEILIGELVGTDVRLHCRDEAIRLRKSRRAQLSSGERGGLFHIDDPGIALRRPGLDSKLDGLRLLHDRPFAAHVVGDTLGEHVDAGRLEIQLMAHRLGKRAVLAASVDSTLRSFIRLRPITNDSGRASFETHRVIAGDLHGTQFARLPAACAFNAGLGAAFYSALPGITPDTSGPDAREHGLVTGLALKDLRQHIGPRPSVWTIEDELDNVHQWLGIVATCLPELSDAFQSALRRLEPALRGLPSIEYAFCHRDFHEGQILLAAGRCGVLDFDTCCMSDPALDIGNLNAHLRLRELRSGENTEGFREAFTTAAREGVKAIDQPRLDAWTRAALLRLAAIYAFTSESRRTIAALLDEARS